MNEGLIAIIGVVCMWFLTAPKKAQKKDDKKDGKKDDKKAGKH